MTHQNIATAADSITRYLGNTSNDIILNVLPLSFDYGLYQVLMAAKVGATVLLEGSFAFPARVLERMRRERVTGFPLVPTIAASPAAHGEPGCRRLSRPSVYHQHGGCAAAGGYRPAATAISDDGNLLDVRAHRMQALYLSASRTARDATRISGPGHSQYRSLRGRRQRPATRPRRGRRARDPRRTRHEGILGGSGRLRARTAGRSKPLGKSPLHRRPVPRRRGRLSVFCGT